MLRKRGRRGKGRTKCGMRQSSCCTGVHGELYKGVQTTEANRKKEKSLRVRLDRALRRSFSLHCKSSVQHNTLSFITSYKPSCWATDAQLRPRPRGHDPPRSLVEESHVTSGSGYPLSSTASFRSESLWRRPNGEDGEEFEPERPQRTCEPKIWDRTTLSLHLHRLLLPCATPCECRLRGSVDRHRKPRRGLVLPRLPEVDRRRRVGLSSIHTGAPDPRSNWISRCRSSTTPTSCSSSVRRPLHDQRPGRGSIGRVHDRLGLDCRWPGRPRAAGSTPWSP